MPASAHILCKISNEYEMGSLTLALTHTGRERHSVVRSCSRKLKGMSIGTTVDKRVRNMSYLMIAGTGGLPWSQLPRRKRLFGISVLSLLYKSRKLWDGLTNSDDSPIIFPQSGIGREITDDEKHCSYDSRDQARPLRASVGVWLL